MPIALRMSLLGPLAAALLLAAAPGVSAQDQAAAESTPASDSGGFDFGGSQPIEISADNGIEWSRDAKTYVARGNAVASQGSSEVHAETLTAYYGAGGSGQIDRMVAEGGVRIMTPNQTAFGDRADYDRARKLLVMTGGALKIESASETVTARDSFEYWQDQDAMVAHGKVAIVKQNGTTIDSDLATSYFRKNATTGKRALYQVKAEGNVRIDTGKEVVTCSHAVYDPVTEIAILTGNVVLTQGGSVFKGARAEIDMKKGISRLMPAAGERVRTVIQPKKNSGQGSSNPDAPATPMASAGDTMAFDPNAAAQ